jgi:hypothetical protein
MIPIGHIGQDRRSLHTTRIGLGVWLLTSLLAVSAAQAGEREEKERAAKKACLSGDYAKGAELLTDLYVDTNDANYIFNQGRCYEQGNRCGEAIISFREYLRKTKDAGKKSDGRAEQHIADCQELLGKAQENAADSRTVVAPPAPLPKTPDPEPAGHAVVRTSLPAASPPAAPGRGLRVAGGIALGLGVGAIGAGVGFALAANQLADELGASPTSYDRDKEGTRSTYATLSTVGYAAGAVCAAGGVLLYVLGWRQGSAAGVQPMVSANTVGALVKVVF